MLFAAAFVQSARAASIVTFVVNDVTDLSDANPGNGVCDTLPGTVGDQCTLRAAIEEINSYPQPLPPYVFQIHFNLGFGGPYTIQPNSPLPVIEEQVIIDGITQPGSSCPTGQNDAADLRVVLDGQNAGTGGGIYGLDFAAAADNSVVRGLVIGNFDNVGINIQNGASGLQILCNYIGIAADGNTAMGNSSGISHRGSGLEIGNGYWSGKNVISGNVGSGIWSIGDSDLIRSNFIGLNAAGTTAVGNKDGIFLNGANNAEVRYNWISGNDEIGLRIINHADVIDVFSNRIGEIAGNGTYGVYVAQSGISGPTDVRIGESGFGNLIINNGADGIAIVDDANDPAAIDVVISANNIRGNGGLGIDLEDDGVTSNDPLDGDDGPNDLQNFPTLTSSISMDGDAQISGSLNSEAGNDYVIEFFNSPTCGSDGEYYLGQTVVHTDASGDANFNVTLDQYIPDGWAVTATAYERWVTGNGLAYGGTSEFSFCVLHTGSVNEQTVNRTSDQGDDDPGDGACDYDNNSSNGEQCTLRAAIEEINAQPSGNGPFTINFNISGAGPHTIAPNSPLPGIAQEVVIDGSTQPGSSCPFGANSPAALKIMLDGSNAGSGSDGITFSGGSAFSTLRGLAIGNFAGGGVRLADDQINLYCNHLGVATNGNTAVPNQWGVVGFNSLSSDIGGDQYAQRNVIAGNTYYGIILTGAHGIQIRGNFVGSTANGLTALGNGADGIRFDVTDNIQIGGSSDPERNVISGNGGNGLSIFEDADGQSIINNYIGTDVFGADALGNGDDGILFYGSGSGAPVNGLVGDTDQENVIAHNGGDGVVLLNAGLDPNNIAIRENSIYGNAELGINLKPGSADGVTVNDSGDGDSGPNGLVNFPVVETAVSDGYTILVDISYDGKPNTLFDFDLYINDSCDASGHGEGQTHVYSDGFLTGSPGGASASVSFTAPTSVGKYLVAAVTHPSEGTSEFSACKLISDARLFVVDHPGDSANSTADGVCDAPGSEDCTLREAILEANAAPFAPVTIEFNIPGGGPHIINTAEPLVITNQVNIDATTQPEAFCPGALHQTGKIQIAVRGAGNSDPGIVLSGGSDGSEIRGLAIYEHGGHAVQIESLDNWLLCNYIGLDPDGNVEGNGGSGIYITGKGNLIGGDVQGQRNVLGGNHGHGIFIDGASDNYVYGNFIGLGPDGDKDTGNLQAGIRLVNASNNVIGGIIPTWGNYITFNNSSGIAGLGGISLVSGSSGNLFQNNRIGADINGVADSGNTRYGIHINNSDDNVIGGNAKGNTIVNNEYDGIAIINNSSAGNVISQNSITGNGGLGIDLGDNGKDTNDNDDLDPGPNGFQNYPEITAVEALTTKTNIDFSLNTAPNSSYTLEFYASASCNAAAPNDYGEGEIYLGKETVSTNGSGTAGGQVAVDVMDSTYLVTATATNNNTNDTSEFSQCFVVCDAGNQTNPMIQSGGSDILLTWSAASGQNPKYNLYRSLNDPYNVTTFVDQVGDLFYEFGGDGGDPAENHYYVVTVERECAESEPSQTVGEFDFAIVPGN